MVDLPLRRSGIPLADAGLLAGAIRRTTIIRLGLLAALVALVGFAVWRAAGLETRTVAFLPESATTIVVLDQSRSVYLADYKAIAAILTRVVQGDPSVGLVAFSDTAYEMLPPGSHGSDLKALLRFYRPTGVGSNIDRLDAKMDARFSRLERRMEQVLDLHLPKAPPGAAEGG